MAGDAADVVVNAAVTALVILAAVGALLMVSPISPEEQTGLSARADARAMMVYHAAAVNWYRDNPGGSGTIAASTLSAGGYFPSGYNAPSWAVAQVWNAQSVVTHSTKGAAKGWLVAALGELAAGESGAGSVVPGHGKVSGVGGSAGATGSILTAGQAISGMIHARGGATVGIPVAPTVPDYAPVLATRVH